MIFQRIKKALIGKALNPLDDKMSHKLALIAFFAWVGLGADGLSSSCYGPEEAFLALRGHEYLSIFVAIASVLTVLVISASYSQIIELFPTGGGGYLVASKLLSPNLGMVSGCALLIDYLLTVTISIASGTDAFFSLLPPELSHFKLEIAFLGVGVLTTLNLRGIKDTIVPLVPIFLIFVFTHIFIILYAIITHVSNFPHIIVGTQTDLQSSFNEIGIFGILFLILRAYSIGAGTYTGIEVVSNGLSILREPRVKTGKKTMLYMSVSLSFTVMGLMLAYLLYNVRAQPGKTLNAVLFENMSETWGPWGKIFIFVTLMSEALILFVAAQTGFVGGPKVLANMALDKWFPGRFAMLSDRLVTQNGILLMGAAAAATMIFTKGSVKFLVVLYSINVFITFCLSQLGMVKHWWTVRKKEAKWIKRLVINGIGLILTTFILCSVTVLKFHEGGWITIAFTGSLIILAVIIKRHYIITAKQLRRLSTLVQAVNMELNDNPPGDKTPPAFDSHGKTAVIMVNGYNGLGLHTLFNVIRFFGTEFKNFVFVEIGLIDAGNFKGKTEVDRLKEQVEKDVHRYVEYMNAQGLYAEGLTVVGVDIIDEIEKVGLEILERFPSAVFFGGQLVFLNETLFTKWLHNYTVFAMQRRFYAQGIPFVVLPIRV